MSFTKFKKDPLFYSLLIIIAVIAIFFRTYNYQNRIFVQADNSRDVQVALYAADNFKLPAIGQFSSAGPFFYGPWYYWFLEIISFLPLGPLTHWYAMTTIYLLFIALIFYLGKIVGGKWLGLVASLYAAVSPAQINYSLSTWNPAIVPTLTLLVLIFLVRFAKYQKPRDIFFLGLTTSLAITIHFQSILASVTLIVALALIFLTKDSKKQKLKLSFLLIFGAFIPFLPLVYFDARHNWHNFVSLFIFLTIDQYKIWIPNRWLTYLGTYWPNTWSYILGGTKLVATLIIILLGLFSASKLKNIQKNKLFFIVVITFLLEIIMYRFYRGERYQYYSLFAHPFVFLLTAWLTVQIYNFKRLLGIVSAAVILFSTVNVAKVDLKARGITFNQISSLKNEIYAKYPDEKFDIYGCKYNIDSLSHPIALFTYIDNRNSLSGIKIGVCEAEKTLVWQELSTEETVTDNGSWFNKSTPEVYRHTVEWWIEKPPGGGNFWQFLKKNYNPACYPHC